MGRKPQVAQALTGAERQARYRLWCSLLMDTMERPSTARQPRHGRSLQPWGDQIWMSPVDRFLMSFDSRRIRQLWSMPIWHRPEAD